MEMVSLLLDFINLVCKVAFITYAWITMLRINAYIKEQEE